MGINLLIEIPGCAIFLMCSCVSRVPGTCCAIHTCVPQNKQKTSVSTILLTPPPPVPIRVVLLCVAFAPSPLHSVGSPLVECQFNFLLLALVVLLSRLLPPPSSFLLPPLLHPRAAFSPASTSSLQPVVRFIKGIYRRFRISAGSGRGGRT